MNQTVIAQKVIGGKTVTRKFNFYSWKLLGNNKEGWEEVSDGTLKTEIKLPPKGETVLKVAEIKLVPVEETKEPVKESKVSEAVQQAFISASESLNKTTIKDYLDSKNIEYKNYASGHQLRIALGEAMNWSIETLNEAFKK